MGREPPERAMRKRASVASTLRAMRSTCSASAAPSAPESPCTSTVGAVLAIVGQGAECCKAGPGEVDSDCQLLWRPEDCTCLQSSLIIEIGAAGPRGWGRSGAGSAGRRSQLSQETVLPALPTAGNYRDAVGAASVQVSRRMQFAGNGGWNRGERVVSAGLSRMTPMPTPALLRAVQATIAREAGVQRTMHRSDGSGGRGAAAVAQVWTEPTAARTGLAGRRVPPLSQSLPTGPSCGRARQLGP